jgi:hypothetical protein
MNTPNEETKAVENSAYNPFPEPRTIPSGWDLSGILSTSQAEPVVVDDGEVSEG